MPKLNATFCGLTINNSNATSVLQYNGFKLYLQFIVAIALTIAIIKLDIAYRLNIYRMQPMLMSQSIQQTWLFHKAVIQAVLLLLSYRLLQL